MTVAEEARQLRLELAELAGSPEWSLLARYDLLPQKPFSSWRNRLGQCLDALGLLPHKPSSSVRWRLGQRLERLLCVGFKRSYYLGKKWHAGLKHGNGSPDARLLLIWAEGMDREGLREACAGFQRLLAGRTDVVPVLVTDVSDFAFYSRLGWLVEYLPDLSGSGASYRDRKKRYLAWRYRDAMVVPASAGFASAGEWATLIT